MPFKISLKSARINSDLTQPQVANALGISVATVVKYEKDSSDIPFSLAQKLCCLYNIPMDYICFGPQSHKSEKIEQEV